ncbi:hypothetical protein [Mucilaginibacter boryungensis]|uniref:Uncharacterized protein n=1 Tax=Mucilaginibacter boryungensis TaxID=768480 RepID=A0ABR9XD74_9SPHI|nr:hypothetical protein [Mucilaginibacter boryungensis]MBE9665191.1 hypothetical protein [Mucilaginibacter boryungensis]
MSKPICITIITLLLGAWHLQAQKLPNVQEVSLRAPANIKIDGRLNEWKDSLQAYNKATQLYYIVSNDDENLYLTVKADQPRVITKLIDVGLTFIINKAGKKSSDAKDNIQLTYPMLDFAPGQQILWYAGSRVRSQAKIPQVILDNDTSRYSGAHVDSLITIANKLMGNHAKNIEVTGITEIKDMLISVYNEERIRAVSRFDKNGAYVYELAIPLKYLNLDAGQKFTYSIHLENRLTRFKLGMHKSYTYINGQPVDVDQDLDSTTDMWGYYTLSK